MHPGFCASFPSLCSLFIFCRSATNEVDVTLQALRVQVNWWIRGVSGTVLKRRSHKGRRGWKRKSSSGEEVLVARKTKKAQNNELEAAEDEIVAAGMEDHCSVLQL
jgi:hypothetical protein